LQIKQFDLVHLVAEEKEYNEQNYKEEQLVAQQQV
jgi:hypothetical protein